MTAQTADIKKWTDDNGAVHYGDIVGNSQQVEIIEVDESFPEMTEGEALMRLKNDLYFQEQDLKQKERQLAYQRALVNKQKKQAKAEKKTSKKTQFRSTRLHQSQAKNRGY